jgi:hypothetical protein
MKTAIRWGYFVLAWAVVADLCLQFYFAAYGAFSAGRSDFGDHTSNAIVVMFLMLAALLVSLAAAARAGLGWARVIGHVVLPLLVIVQSVLFIIADAFGATEQNPIPALLALHGLNGVAMLILSLWLGLGALRLVRTGTSGPETAAQLD